MGQPFYLHHFNYFIENHLQYGPHSEDRGQHYFSSPGITTASPWLALLRSLLIVVAADLCRAAKDPMSGMHHFNDEIPTQEMPSHQMPMMHTRRLDCRNTRTACRSIALKPAATAYY